MTLDRWKILIAAILAVILALIAALVIKLFLIDGNPPSGGDPGTGGSGGSGGSTGAPPELATYRWPMGDGVTANEVGTAFGQYLSFDNGATYDAHNGVDLMSAEGETVFAIEEGEVVYIETDPWVPSDSLGYGIVVEAADGHCIFYYHLEQPAGGHSLQQKITVDKPIGTIPKWTHHAGFDHLHLSFVTKWDDFDTADPDDFPFDFVGNPLPRFDASGDMEDPTVSDLKFFENDLVDELNSLALHGKVDVVAKVADLFTGASDWPLVPFEIEVEITRLSDGRQSYHKKWTFDGAMPTAPVDFVDTVYKNDGSVEQGGGYDDRAFWVIATHEPPTSTGAWDTGDSESGLGDYNVRVAVKDPGGRPNHVDVPAKVVSFP